MTVLQTIKPRSSRLIPELPRPEPVSLPVEPTLAS